MPLNSGTQRDQVTTAHAGSVVIQALRFNVLQMGDKANPRHKYHNKHTKRRLWHA